jgi:hypothetical protein
VFDGTAAAGGVVIRTPDGPFADFQGPASRANDRSVIVVDLERAVTAGDGAVTDSFVNNAG